MTDTERAPATEEKVTDLRQYANRKELSEVPPQECEDHDDWYFD